MIFYLDNNYEVLWNLLYGIFLVREVLCWIMDYVLSFGERNFVYIIFFVLKEYGINVSYLDVRRLVKMDKSFGFVKVDFDCIY